MKKLCQNCKHFVQHYHINCLNRICPTNCGICKLKKINDKESKKSSLDRACELWETNERDVNSLEGSLDGKLEKLINQLSQIVQNFNLEK